MDQKDLVHFHRTLMGRAPSAEQSDVYHQIQNGMRGCLFREGEDDSQRFVALLVAALYQTAHPTVGLCHLICPPSAEKWCLGIARNLFRALVRSRKKFPRKDVLSFVETLERVAFQTRPLTMPSPPERWVAYGFNPGAPVPPWMAEKLF